MQRISCNLRDEGIGIPIIGITANDEHLREYCRDFGKNIMSKPWIVKY
jgi:hypothetical protein